MTEENKFQSQQIDNQNYSKRSTFSVGVNHYQLPTFKRASNMLHQVKRVNSSFQSNSGSYQKKFISDSQNSKVLLNSTDGQAKWKQLEQIMKKLKFKTYVKKFLMLSRKRLYKLLNITQVNLINDQASYFDFEKQAERQKKKNLLTQKKQNEVAQWMIFNPNNIFLEIWSFIKIICIIICFFFYLVSFAFSVSIQELLSPYISFGCQFFLVLDIFVHLNTAIYLKGQLNNSRSAILQQYMSSKCFYRDLIQVIAYFLYQFLVLTDFTPTFLQQLLLLPIVLKYQDLNNMLQKMKIKYIQKKETQNIFELINLIKNILFISHVFSCIWILTAKLNLKINQGYLASTQSVSNQQNFTTWIDFMNIQNENWAIQYLYSYYFIVVTMITVGYGDVKPTNPLEVGVCIVLMMTCCLVFGFAINQIGYIFQDVYLREKNIFQKRNIISKYMQKKEINSKVQQQVFEYLEYTWREEIDEHIQEANIILNQLSGNLKQLISLESNKLILKQNRILKDNFDKQILQEIIPYIQEQNCTPGEIVIDCQIGNVECYLYFVQQGQLEFFSNGQKSEKINNYQDVHSIKKIFQGENFGQQSFFTGAKENLGVRSLSFSTLLKIKRSDFVNILKQYQSDYEKFCMIKDKIIFSGFYAQLNEQCSSCKERTHSEILCPILHYIPKKFKILQENDRNFPHITRNSSFQRNISHKTNTLKELENNVYRIVQFIEDKCEDLDQFENQNLEYPCFQNEYNNSFNEIDEHQDKVFQNASNEQMQPQFQKSSLVKDEIAFPRRRSKILALIHTNSLMNSQKALDEEIQQHIQNQSEEGSDLVNKRKRLNQIKKNVISESMEQQNNKLTQELDELTESHLYQKYGQNNRVSFINQSLKDLQISEKCTKHQISSENANNFQVQIENQAKVSIDFPSKFILHSFQNYDFEVFQGKFESLQNFKYYYPFQNCKEIINKLNEINLSKRNKMGIKKTSKNDNSTCYGRRNNLFKFIQQLKSSHRDQKTDSNQISINQSFEFNIKQQNADFSSNKQAQNSSSKLEQSNISSFEEIQLNQSKQSNEISNQNQNNTIKVDLEIPLFEEDQEHFQIQPSSSQCKRSYLFGQQSQLQKSLY
ncbi:cyclic nucleotide-binding domain protein (macronuclear) [Tetrahymena thermophila SB210]|uniref:Cyclic nucleotide-binding domain protein n=1 Tax=Tetrahymena thermophila (strain SB210) TaxID=312017 RepID=Q233Q7_TETTS|nr:cyclic nucleotide-binding domain protein [Tetrahymena thermophila SB210]EAR91772.2 cyclic nucleotide-binding domain protein [Tetrahymena thermophila SB210]|eukprot:XP_001012017.2 cyclic nucleotide-binding domain protein [Tetrahymena thermophila SB210]